MKISINSIRALNQRYGCADDIAPDGVEALVEKIGAQLGAVEETVDIGKKYQGVVVVRIVKCEPHPNADKLRVCLIDDGGVTPDVKRDGQGYVEVVCGASNVREGLVVPWLPPGATVPNTVGGEPFVLEVRELRGVVSNGMLASPKELGLGDNHEGIMELDDDIAPGTLFAEQFNLVGDQVIDIENKMFTHRPDLFGSLGVSRELAGIQRMPFKSPDWYQMDLAVPDVEAGELLLEVRNELPELVSRFTAIALGDVKVGPSPVWLQVELAKVGLRPINNIVDLTNYFMVLTGQPLHAYDYDKVKALDGDDTATIVIRYPKPDETVKLLNGKEIKPRNEAIMIATASKLIGVGGVMGGAETEVDETTKNIIIEVANFDMYSIRRTAMAHGLFTDAVTRFNKGQSPLQTKTVLLKIVDDIRSLANGNVASPLVDDNHVPAEVLERGSVHPPVAVTVEFINVRLGLQLSGAEIKALLTSVEFDVQVQNDNLTVKAPFWRTDIEIPEDVVEEVGRLYGYDHLPLELPQRDLTPAQKDPMLKTKAAIRAALSKAGANEVLTYSFVHGNLLDKVGQNRTQAYQLSNAISPDLQYFRLSLTPCLLEKVHPNIKTGYGEFALFEIGKAHNQKERDEAGLPREVNAVSLVFAVDDKVGKHYEGAAYYEARKYIMNILADFKVTQQVTLEPLADADLYQQNPWIEQMIAPYEPHRSAVLRDSKGLIWGVVGEFKASVRTALKLPVFSAGFELDPLLVMQPQTESTYVPLPRYPKVQQDITLKVAADMSYRQLFDFVWSELTNTKPDNTYATLSPLDIYQRSEDPEHKQITLRLAIASYDKTLRDTEVADLLDEVAAAAKEKLGAGRI